MYLMMFFAAYKLRRRKDGFRFPFGKRRLLVTCIFGSIGTLLTIGLAFTLPPEVPILSLGSYALLIVVFNLI